MPATFKYLTSVAAYGDPAESGNPKLRFFDWTRSLSGVVADRASFEQVILDPGQSLVLGKAGTTPPDAAVTVEPASKSGFYRVSIPGLNTAPDLTGLEITLTPLDDGTLRIDRVGGPALNLVPKQTVFIPGVNSGDAPGLFSELNVGFWTVVGRSGDGAGFILTRPDLADSSGAAETVTVAAKEQFQVLNPFQGQLLMDAVTDSTVPLEWGGIYPVARIGLGFVEIAASGKGAFTTAGPVGFKLLGMGTKYLRVEVDQLAGISPSGGAPWTHILNPVIPGDLQQMAWAEFVGEQSHFSVVNLSSAPMTVNVMSVL